MKRILTIIISIILVQNSIGQIIDIDYTHKNQEFVRTNANNIEPFGKGFIDLFSNGEMQSTAEVLKIRIGEPNKFSLPFSLLIGTSGNGLGEEIENENTAASLLNPIGGFINGAFNGQANIFKLESNITSLKFAYQLSGKLINATDSLNKMSTFLGSAYSSAGFFFQTGAWEMDNPENLGVFWIQAKATASYGFTNEDIRQIFGNETKDNFFIGYSVDLGIEIKNRINLKAGMYQFLNNQILALFEKPVFKFAVDFNLKK